MTTTPHRIIGVDPGSRLTGWGVIEIRGEQAKAVAWGAIAAGDGEFCDRLGTIFEELAALLDQHGAAEAAFESVFMNRNAASALKLGQARGAAVAAAVSRRLPVAEYPPTRIKQALVGRGRADKTQVQHMVRVLLGIAEPLQADAADALAVALCHHHTKQTLDRMSAAGVKR